MLGSVFFSPLQAKRLVESMQLAGGSTTIFSRSFAAFELPAEGLTDQELKRHMDTDPLFDRSHIPLNDHKNAGLGPLHNAKSCSACHVLNGRGRAVLGESLFRISLNKDKGDQPVFDQSDFYVVPADLLYKILNGILSCMPRFNE